MQSILTYLTLAAILVDQSALAITKSPGCGKALSPGIKTGGTGSSNGLTLTSNGLKRTYLLHLPSAYSLTKPHGLIFSFHGRSESGSYQEKLSKFSNSDVNQHMLAVYPDGINNEWQGDPNSKTDDVKFTLDILEKISNEYCLDMDKIYASGKSNGGGFSANILACDPIASTKIAAFAGFSGAYYQTFNGTCDAATVPIKCNPGRTPVPIFEVHGSADGVITYNGGPRRSRCLPSLPHFMTEWAKRNGLGAKNESTIMNGGKVVKYEYGTGDNRGVNTHYWVQGLGHVWADTQANADGCCSVINGSVLAMAFFEKWTLNSVGAPSPYSIASSTSSTRASATTPSSTIRPSTADSKTSQASSATKTSSSISSSPLTYPSPDCPSADGTSLTTAAKTTFQIFCGYDTTAAYYGSPIYNLRSFGKCISACEEMDDCGHVVYNGVCYLKKAVKGMKRTGGKANRVAVKLG